MGVLTRDQMVTEVRFGIGGRNLDIESTRIVYWLDWTYQHCSHPSVYPHRQLQSNGTFALANGDDNYNFTDVTGVTDPTHVMAIRLLFNQTRGTRIVPKSLRQMEELRWIGSGNKVTGPPDYYSIEGTTLQLSPVPGSANTGDTVALFYWKSPGQLSSSGPASIFATEWDEILIQGGIWRGLRFIGQTERAETAKVEFGQLINEVQNRVFADQMEDPSNRSFEVDLTNHYMEP